MRHRCNNPKDIHWDRYGGRGIKVCPEWDGHFSAFRDWAKSSGFRPDLEIDRIDNNLGYSPENCRWTTRQQNCANREVTPKRIAACRKMRAMQDPVKMRIAIREAQRVEVRCKETQQVFQSVGEAAVSIGLTIGAVSRVLRGKNQTAGGYHWEYA